MDVMRVVIEAACLAWMVWATLAYVRWRTIADDLRDEIEAADDALAEARKRISELKQDLELQLACNKNHIDRFDSLETLCELQRSQIAELQRRKGKPMACKGKKTGKKVKR